MTSNLDWLTARPIAHRGLHDAKMGIYENTLSACKAAIDRRFNIEVDMHPAKNKAPVIFHDLTLERMSADPRNVRDLDSGQLRKIHIGDSSDYIATLDELLELTAGKVGLVLEMKGLVGQDEDFVEAVARCLIGYDGPVVLMSFHHWLLRDTRKFAPHIPLGLVAKGDEKQYDSHKMIADQCAIDFVTYKWQDLPCNFATQFANSGRPLICWTTKTPQQSLAALQYCDQITFEGFDPDSIL